MEEYTAEQIAAVKEFANGLRECYEEKRKSKYKDAYVDEVIGVAMNYAINVLNLHVDLAEIKFDRFMHNMEAYRDKKIVEEKA